MRDNNDAIPVCAIFFTYKSRKNDTKGTYWVYRDYVIYVLSEAHRVETEMHIAESKWLHLGWLDDKGYIEIQELNCYHSYQKNSVVTAYTCYGDDV